MKKTLLALVLFLTILLGFPIGRLFALETVYLTPEFIDNATYNLETGAYIPLNTSWACTNRETVPVGTAVVTVNNLLAHHVLFFTETNGYIGYGNLIASYEGGTRYIATYADSSIELPANTAKVAFTVNKMGSAVPSGLGAYTYEDIFESPTYLTYTDGTLPDTLGDTFDATIGLHDFNVVPNGYFDADDSIYFTKINIGTPTYGSGAYHFTATAQYGNFGTNLSGLTSGDKIYVGAMVQVTTASIGYVHIQVYNVGDEGVQIDHAGGGGYELLSTIITSDGSTMTYKVQDSRGSSWSEIDLDYLVAYNLTDLYGAGNEPTEADFEYLLSGLTLDTLGTITNIGFTMDRIEGQASEFTSESITVLSLTNLIQNGINFDDSDSDGYPDYFYDNTTYANSSVTDNIWKYGISSQNYTGPKTGYIQMGFLLDYFKGNKYYFGLKYILSSSNTTSVNFLINDGTTQGATTLNSDDTLRYISDTFTVSPVATDLYVKIQPNVLFNDYIYVYEIYLIDVDVYTKTQIDTALSYFGYLTYNTQYDLPDSTDADFTARYYINGATIGTDLYLLDLAEARTLGFISTADISTFNAWRSAYTFSPSGYFNTLTGWNPLALELNGYDTSDAEQNAYYFDLWADATTQTERFEWYAWAGVTAVNYTALRATYDFYEDNYGTNYSLAEFDNLVVDYDREELVPIEDLTVVEKIEDWFENTLGLAEFAEFFYFIISLVLVVIIVIVLAVFHAPSIIILVVGGLTLVLFIAIGWFSFWLALLLTIGLIALFVFKKPSGGNA